jgi:hypothetical protein
MARQTFTSGQTLTANQMTQLQNSVWSDDVNAQTGTSYTLVLTDAGKQVTMTNAAASTLTVPPNASVAFAVGVRIQVIQLGAGAVTLTAGLGVTISSLATSLVMAQYQVATLVKTDTNIWVAILGAAGSGTAIVQTIVDAKGDLIVASADNTVGRLPVGATAGHVLTVDSTETLGMKWAAGGGGGGAFSELLLIGA